MILKSKSIATRLLLLSCFYAVIVIVAILSFIKFSVLPRMTENSLENQTSALAYSLKGQYNQAEQWSETSLATASQALSAFSREGKSVATLFLFKNGDYVRLATTLKKADGSLALGTALDQKSEAFQALSKGRPYSGHLTLFDRLHMTTYLPVVFNNGTRGAVFVGIDYQSADPMLAMAGQMDYVVLGVGVVSVLLLGLGLFFSVRVEQAHRETEDIMRTTQEGIFLLDHELRMGSQTSQALSRVLGFDVFPGANFLDLLKPAVTPNIFETAKEYIDLLLRHDVKEKLVASLNPLECLEVNHLQANGKMQTRFLRVSFNRVLRAKKITHLLVTANDITRQVKLERELREKEIRMQDQMSMMVHILSADHAALQQFLGNAGEALEQVNEELRISNPRSGISNLQLSSIMRLAHRLKGDASALQLDAMVQSLHEFENLITGLQAQSERSSEDLLPVAVQVKALFSEIATIQEVINQISQIQIKSNSHPAASNSQASPAAEIPPQLQKWNAFVQELGARHGKKAELIYQGIDLETLDSELRGNLNSILNQFIRNALVHGVETPAERKACGKSETARLSVYLSDLGDGNLALSFRDDGRGVDLERVRAAAANSGKYTAEAAQALNTKQLTTMIFQPGLSTHGKVDEDAGRGVGLDSVKNMINAMGGRLRFGTVRGESCFFRIALPMQTYPRQHAGNMEDAA
jgi:HPt (histidine-containing phosphotransfer) domain-containing protein